METIPVFLSHITEDKALAGYLQARIRRDFLKAIDVFVSSDGVSIEAGSDWLQSLRSALDRAKCVVVLCSPTIDDAAVGEFRGRGGLAEGPTDYAALSWGLGAGSTKTPILAIAGGQPSKIGDAAFALPSTLAFKWAGCAGSRF